MASYSRTWKLAMLPPWLALGAMLFEIWRVYPSLPPVIASHFNAAGVPNGWAPKQDLFSAIVPIAFGLVLIFTILLTRFPQISGIGWLLMVCEYWSVGLFAMLLHGTLLVARGDRKTLEAPVGVWTVIMVGALAIGEFGRVRSLRQRADRDHGRLLAEERHGSIAAAVILAGLSLVSVLGMQWLHAKGPALVICAVIGFAMLASAVWAYTGFVYRVSENGLEIRMLGVPIRFVDATDIAFVNARKCNALTDFGGWGIRGIGNMRAYIWGGDRCVHVRTSSGEDLYLGSNHAERLASELSLLVPVAQ